MACEFYINFEHSKGEVLVSFKCWTCDQQVLVEGKTEFKDFEKEFEEFRDAHRHG